MKKILFFSIVLLFSFLGSYAQNYKQIKITLKDGNIVKGSQGTINNEAISFLQGSDSKTYLLSDISMIQARKGSGGIWAAGCAGGCLGYLIYDFIYIGGASGITNDYGSSVGAFIGAGILCIGASAGVGYLIGSAFDHYEIVYSKNLSMLKQFDFNFTTNQMTRYTPQTNNFTLSYRF